MDDLVNISFSFSHYPVQLDQQIDQNRNIKTEMFSPFFFHQDIFILLSLLSDRIIGSVRLNCVNSKKSAKKSQEDRKVENL